MEIEVYSQVKNNVKKLLDINLDHYKDEQMRRRLDSWLVRSGTPDWNTYFHRLRGDETERSRFRDYLTINVTALFRDPERWQALREKIIPGLLSDALRLRPANAGLRVWSAGCSIGAEPFSLAILLDELSPARRHFLLATDLDRGVLQKAARRGPFNADETQNLSASQRVTYLENAVPPYYVKPSLAKRVEFREQNLLSDPFPDAMDLILCRNVVIYFTAETKDALYRKFSAALREGGVLFVGATEIISRPQEVGLTGCGISFYRKVSA